MPAFAGMTQEGWMPAFAGMTTELCSLRTRHSRAGGNPGVHRDRWMPAFAGMTDDGLVPGAA